MQNAQAHADVVSDTPGRLRLRLRRPHRHPHILHNVHEHLHQQEGIGHVSTNSATGSVMVKYDPHRLSTDDVLGLVKDVGVICLGTATELGELPESSHSTTATGIISAMEDLDRRLSLLTDRRIDLKLLFPAGLFTLGLRQALAEGLGLTQVPAYVLMWYAFDSFWKFHKTPATAPSSQGGAKEPVAEAGVSPTGGARGPAHRRRGLRVAGEDNG